MNISASSTVPLKITLSFFQDSSSSKDVFFDDVSFESTSELLSLKNNLIAFKIFLIQ